MSQFDLDVIDVEGAVREAEEAVAGDTRAAFFRKAAITGGTVGSAAFFTGMLPALAEAKPSKKQDVAILKYALTLEYLEAAFYTQAVSQGGLGGNELALAKLLAAHERTHVAALRKTIKSLGSKVPASPEFDFKGSNTNTQFIKTAYVLENTGVHAYLGQAPRLKNKGLLTAAAEIVTIEARHASAVAVLLNQNPFQDNGSSSITPDGAFDTPKSMKAILKAVGKTGFIKG